MIGLKKHKKKVDMGEQLKEIEINLYDCLEAMRKRKKVVIFILAISVVISLGVMRRDVFLRPGMFEIAMFLDPGIIGIAESGEKIYLNSVGSIGKEVKDKVYRWRLNEELGDRSPCVSLDFSNSSVLQRG
ncbi:MAG: hypothetical protein ABID32_05815 [Candidatus Omnitrophota bacterium]